MRGLCRILSGGQTGVDQAALRAALAAGLSVSGWCPPGRRCETGTIPALFPLIETPEDRSAFTPDVPRSLRTEWNVRDSDATLILHLGPVADSGTMATRHFCACRGKPLLAFELARPDGADAVLAWLRHERIEVLNVAGPAESAHPGIGARAFECLLPIFAACRETG